MSLKSPKIVFMFSVGMAYPPPQRKREVLFRKNPDWTPRSDVHHPTKGGGLSYKGGFLRWNTPDLILQFEDWETVFFLQRFYKKKSRVIKKKCRREARDFFYIRGIIIKKAPLYKKAPLQ